MPGVPKDMNGYRDFEVGHLRTSSYANGYDPQRPDYRDAGYGRSGRHNGIDPEFEQNSFDGGMRDGTERSFEVDHLATYTSKSGTTHPEDGLMKLKQMESSTGIWTMRCLLMVEPRHIIVIDKGNGDELERFPLSQVHEPTAVLKNDRRETYNNLILFTVIDDPRRKNSPSDMHIFQSVNAPAHDIVDEVLAAKGEGAGRRGPYDRSIPPPPSGPAPEPPYGGHHGYGQSRGEVTRASYIHRDDMDTGQNEALERDVQLLNNCFDDIEKFVSRLQQAAEAFKELERRRYERGHRNKRKSAGDGMLTMRARPPPADDFIDIFQKFKFAFNLLAKLKAHIHDPNAPELVHFLFTPLSLIYEASRDPIHQGEDLSGRAVTPLLVYEAKQLLLNCLTSKELELWQRLGKSWTLTKEDFRDVVQPYTPRFYNGWQPSPQVIEEINRPGPSGSAVNRSFRQEEFRSNAFPEPDPYPREDPYKRKEDVYRREDPYTRSAREDPYIRSSRRERDDFRPPSPPAGRFNESKRDSLPPPQPKTRAEENYSYSQELKRMGATIYEAVHERQGKNAKELTVEKGDIVQVLDRSRNWWKLKNCKGETGYAPYTILKEYQASNDYDNMIPSY